MTESEKLDRIFGQEDSITKCLICGHNFETRCGARHYDEFNNLRPEDFCSDFEIRNEEPEIEDELPADNLPTQNCPICGEDAVWDPVLHKYICKNDDCGYEFS